MLCHLMTHDVLSLEDLGCFETIKRLTESDHFERFVTRCRQCGQLYFACFYEITGFDDDDECWNFWVPITASEMEQIQSGQVNGLQLINDRRHIRYGPTDPIKWANGPESALVFCLGVPFTHPQEGPKPGSSL